MTLPADQRPVDPTWVHTADLPDTPTRDRNIPATAWLEAPPTLIDLGEGLPGTPVANYKRRIGPWLLWRAGPARGDHARYLAIDHRDLGRQHRFDLEPEGVGMGTGPDGQTHQRFRTWKEALRDGAEPPER